MGFIKIIVIQVLNIKSVRVSDMEKRFDNPKNILIVRLGAMGDIVHVIPAVENLRMAFPAARIVWLVEDKNKDLVE